MLCLSQTPLNNVNTTLLSNLLQYQQLQNQIKIQKLQDTLQQETEKRKAQGSTTNLSVPAAEPATIATQVTSQVVDQNQPQVPSQIQVQPAAPMMSPTVIRSNSKSNSKNRQSLVAPIRRKSSLKKSNRAVTRSAAFELQDPTTLAAMEFTNFAQQNLADPALQNLYGKTP